MKRSIKSLLAALVVSSYLVAPVLANPSDEGLAAYDRKDYATAIRLWRPLAKKGNATLQVILATLYAQGKGAPQDYEEAIVWYRLAAEQGDPAGQHGLAGAYHSGNGVRKDVAKAVEWCRKSAEQNYALSQVSMGTFYARGLGVPKNDTIAYMWYNLAASKGAKNAAKYRNLAAERMTPAQIAEAQRLAREWKPKK